MKRLLLCVALALPFACDTAEAHGPHHARHFSPYWAGYYNTPVGFGAGGIATPFGYQPFSSFTYPVATGGALTQFYGGFAGPGFYMPYTYSAYQPGFGVY